MWRSDLHNNMHDLCYSFHPGVTAVSVFMSDHVWSAHQKMLEVSMDSLRKHWGCWVGQMQNNIAWLSPSTSHSQRRADSIIRPTEEKRKYITPYSEGFAFYACCVAVLRYLQSLSVHTDADMYLYIHTHAHTAPAKSGCSFQEMSKGGNSMQKGKIPSPTDSQVSELPAAY